MGIKYITPFLSSGRDNLTVHLDLNLLCVKRLMANRCQDLYKVIQWDLKDTIYTFLRFGKKMSSHWNFLILSNFHFKLFFFSVKVEHFTFPFCFCICILWYSCVEFSLQLTVDLNHVFLWFQVTDLYLKGLKIVF